jgi:hypothetical protein
MNTTSSVEVPEVREGVLTSFNPLKNCGTLTVRMGTKVESFFFHAAKLTYCEVEINEIRIGLWARFRVSEVPPRPGNFRHAIDVELYIQNPALVTVMEILSGKAAQ